MEITNHAEQEKGSGYFSKRSDRFQAPFFGAQEQPEGHNIWQEAGLFSLVSR
jgi:hypothetical protein